MSRSATVPLMLETTTIDPPTSASIMACAAARMVSQVPVRFTAKHPLPLAVRLVQQQRRTRRCRRRPPPGWARRARARFGSIAAVTASGSLMSQSMSPPDWSHTTTSWPASRNRPATSRPIPDAPPVTSAVAHAAGPINSTSTPSGAVITAIGTVSPAGAGIVMRRTPSVKPNAAKPAASHRRHAATTAERIRAGGRSAGSARRRLPRRPRVRRCRCRVLADHLGISTAADPILAPKSSGQLPREGVVEQLGQPQPVAPESQRTFDIGGADRRMMNTQHEFPFRYCSQYYRLGGERRVATPIRFHALMASAIAIT